MEILTEPVKPASGRDQRDKDPRMEPDAWVIMRMNNPSDKWKITDGETNIADMFDSKEDALQYKTWLEWDLTVHPPDVSRSSIALKYTKKQGGQEATKFSGPKYSEHGDDNKPRNSLYSKPKDAFSATNGQIAGYVRMKLRRKDQILYKVMSGGHGDDHSMGGRCYGCGFEIDGDETKIHAVKEINHPTTPRITNKVEKLFTGNLPPLNNKTVGYRINHWVNSEGHTVVEFDADFSILDIPPKDITVAPNKWQPIFRFIDKGNWDLSRANNSNQKKNENANIKENSGITYGGGELGYYFRADEVKEGDGSASQEQAVEIVAPN
ncbi:hypothetical protein [Candidatus Nitrosocosmicus sp. SS]|jgi:hypothetical protein|uniref:hypothetical protein n=1 Tax=Candidatus Nitrosocosmicus agrestis TaxID=2563600 RepID=UPI00122E5AE5|nr:hypothetical protein [Candidatus Nitrosocosmicus sp. SS]KAA2283530.1 hypothetical protein F1Z66_01205 [Candidatus Nitrosocosmicus sp. SS]KAF0869610.1 hypothetical protein E5N71_03735 [Candidatus Nitrosocosmicus sp. SS]MDR4490267.1 hypothetical protein [Candidatus Nitrosocosmicus sp.]